MDRIYLSVVFIRYVVPSISSKLNSPTALRSADIPTSKSEDSETNRIEENDIPLTTSKVVKHKMYNTDY